MSAQLLVNPEQIESELLKLWDQLSKEKIRACLFNLIVFNKLSARTDYIRNTVQKVSEKYPCRVLFISSDPESPHPYLKTAVSVVGGGNIACDYIDIGFSGSEIEKVPFLLLPHFVPDLPISLLWTEDPSFDHPLFEPLVKLSSRIIFDSESADSLLSFAKTILKLQERGIDTADLNWARTEGWRDLIASLFPSKQLLDQIEEVKISYNGRTTEVFCHLKVQSLYVLAWLASRLGWKFVKAGKEMSFIFEKQKGQISSVTWENLGSGTITSIDFSLKEGHLFSCSRDKKEYHRVNIQISSQEKCELPSNYVLGKTATGQTLIKEIINQGTSSHYIEMLKEILNLDRDQLC